MTAPLQKGAEPFSVTGSDRGVLVLHGFTGTPYSMRPLAEVIADHGYSVELPLLPGHGTAVEDLLDKRWEDWTAHVASTYEALASRCPGGVALVGQSVGGGLSCWLAARHPEVVALVAINPMVQPIAQELRDGSTALLDAGAETIDGVASDIAKPGADEHGYDRLPVRAAMSLMEGLEAVSGELGAISCPVLVLTSREDHVISADNSELLAAKASGPVEHVWLEHSYHVATLDYDAGLVEAESCRFLDAAFDGR